MVKSAFSILAVAAVGGIALTPVAASAATAGPTVLAYSSSPSAGDPDTTVTFTVSSGALSMTAPATVDLGTNAPGTTISGSLGTVTVTDDRALLAAAWTVVASSSDWTTGAGTLAETIPAGDVGYDAGSITTTGTITATGTPVAALAGLPRGGGDRNRRCRRQHRHVESDPLGRGSRVRGRRRLYGDAHPVRVLASPPHEVRAAARPGPVTKGRTCAARSASRCSLWPSGS